MFSNLGMGEILVLLIIGLFLIGPERLPKVVQDLRAMIVAARTAINDARENLSTEFGEDFDDLRNPLQDLGELRRLNPKAAITRTLFEGDDTYLDMLSGKPAVGSGSAAAQAAGESAQMAQPTNPTVAPPASTPGAAAQPTPNNYPAPSDPAAAGPGETHQPRTSSWVDEDVL